MAARTLPNLGLKAFFALGEDGWNDEIDLNFLKLSVLTQGGVADVVTTKPLSPTEGAVYLIAAAAISNPNTIAVYDNGEWKHFAPNAGWTVYNRADDSYRTWCGTEWRVMPLANLRALGLLDTSAGLVEQTGDNTFSKRAIGAASATDILSRSAGDARYSLSGHTHPVTGVTAFNTRTGDVTLGSSDIQSALGYVPAATHPHLTSLSGLGSTTGLIEQTGANAFSKRAIGTSSPSDIPSLAMADTRYQGLHATLSGLTMLLSNNTGVVEQYGPHAFRIRSIGSTNSTDILTRGAADSIYVAAVDFSLSQLTDVPDSYVGKAHHALTVKSAENGIEFTAPGQVNIRTVTADTTLTALDAGAMIRVSHATGAAVTVPNNISVAFPVGTTIELTQVQAGKIVINPAGGVQIDFLNGKDNKSLNPNAVVKLVKYDTNSWTLSGDLAAAGALVYTADSVLIEADNNTITADAV